MPIPPTRWRKVSESEYPWEREALECLAQELPSQEPVRMWSNFEFISNDGHINEVDALILTSKGLFLVEIKSRPAKRLTGDSYVWSWQDGSRTVESDNPVIPTDRKSKRLASLLAPLERKESIRLPFIESLVFCSAPGIDITMPPNVAIRVFGRDRRSPEGTLTSPGIIQAVTNADVGPRRSERVIDAALAGALARMLDKAGVCRARSARRVNGYKLVSRIGEGPLYEDFSATHPTLNVTRRVRLYPYPQGASQDLRQTIRRAAEREFRALENITHPSLLKPLEFQDSDFGPSLLFDLDPAAQRLDHFVYRRQGTLSLETRVHLIREIAETVRFAHEHRRIHRALSPQCILVKNPDSAAPTIQVMNWHSGTFTGEGSTGVPTVLGATDHLSRLVDEAQTVYLAPEASQAAEVSEAADVFSLGAVAYFILTGQPPGATALDVAEKLRRDGLLLTDVIDAPSRLLVEMVRDATAGALSDRSGLDDFLTGLDLWEEDATAPDAESRLNPADATSGDELPQGFRVEKRLGKGATAVALQVRRSGETLVLKVALGPEYNERVREEGEVLRKLDHPRIVKCLETIDFEPQIALVLQFGGERTLGKMLSDEGRLSLEFLDRFGGELLDAVSYLESEGIWHRDIKPQNIGIVPSRKDSQLQLVLYDFSLARTPLDQIRAGTPGYLDPFISLRQPPRYDLQAERFAAAVTLYEMATGKQPTWGDGSDPAQLDCEATIDTDSMDSTLREGFVTFFRRALAREAKRRFDNAADMRAAWREVFAAADRGTAHGTDSDGDGPQVFDATLVEAATLDTPIDQLGISARGVNAMERLGASTLRDMLRTPVSQVFAMRGVGNKTRRELRQAFDRYRDRFASVDMHAPTLPDAPEDGRASIDKMFLRLLTAKDREAGNQADILQHILGLAGDAFSLPSQTDVAARVDVTRAWVSAVMQKPRNRWAKDPALTGVRSELLELLNASGGVMGAGELAGALVDRRGSSEDGDARIRRSVAVLRAALEAEESLKEPRFSVQRRDTRVVVSTDGETAAYGFALGQKADELAAADLLLPPVRVIQQLREVSSPVQAPLDDARLLRVATIASAGAAVSPRMEIYPRGMSALRAAKLCNNLAPTVGPDGRSEEFTVEDVRRRVSGRFPEAEPLPDRPVLDEVLAAAEWNVQWAQTSVGGGWAYTSSTRQIFSTSDRTLSRRPTVVPGALLSDDDEAVAARRFDERLRAAAHHGGFLVLTVPEKSMLRAEAELKHQFGVPVVSLERELIKAMREVSRVARVHWDIVLRADAAARGSRDWQNLRDLVQRALPQVAAAIPRSAPPALLTCPGLLSRYDQWPWLTDLAQTTGRGDGIHGAWLLVPWEDPSVPPSLGEGAVPLLPSQRAHIPDGWLTNRHRAA